jgi:hypothetical protein
MMPGTVVICEIKGDWAALVRRDIPHGVSIVEIRQCDELWPCLLDMPRAVLAIELRSQRASDLLESLTRVRREFPQAVPIVLAPRNLCDWEEPCREAGALAFIAGPRNTGDLVEIIQFRQSSQAQWTQDEESPLEDRIVASLPWAN